MKEEFMKKVMGLATELEKVIDEAELYSYHKSDLRARLLQFCSEADSKWDYSHPGTKD